MEAQRGDSAAQRDRQICLSQETVTTAPNGHLDAEKPRSKTSGYGRLQNRHAKALAELSRVQAELAALKASGGDAGYWRTAYETLKAETDRLLAEQSNLINAAAKARNGGWKAGAFKMLDLLQTQFNPSTAFAMGADLAEVVQRHAAIVTRNLRK
jgi:hypothetical protein